MTSAMKSAARSRLYTAARWLAALVALGFIARYVLVHADQLRGAELDFHLPTVLGSFAVLLLYLAGRSLAWHHITRRLGVAVPLSRAFVSWNYSLLGKYLPGKVFLLLGRLHEYHRADKSMTRVTLAFFLETVSTLLASVLTILLALLLVEVDFVTHHRWLLWIALGTLLVMLHPWPLSWAINGVLRALRRPGVVLDLRLRDTASFVGLATVNWLVFGVAFYLFIHAVYPLELRYIVFLAGAISVASLAGILVLVAPSGLGVREGILTLLLAQVMPAPVAAMLSLASRLWVTLGEGVGIGLAFAMSRGRSLPAPSREPPKAAEDAPPVPGGRRE